MVKRLVLVHGWEGNPFDGWKSWLKSEVLKMGFKFIAPPMPGGKHPILQEWLNVLSSEVGNVDNETYFVGHSLGCIAILKYFEQLPLKSRARACFLVSGFISSLKIPETENFFIERLNTKKVISKVSSIVAINSDNDPYVPINYAYEIREKLHAELIIEHAKGHIGESAGIKELPNLLNKILEISK